MDNWQEQIAVAHLVKQRVADADVQGLWPLYLPEVAATDEQISRVEKALDESIDPGFRSFLCYANGWRCFFQAIDLLGAEQILDSPERLKADMLLASLEDLRGVCGVEAAEVLPIAVSQDSIDLVLLGRSTGSMPGAVFWVAGQLIDQFASFDEFFLAMVDYNRAEAEALEKT